MKPTEILCQLVNSDGCVSCGLFSDSVSPDNVIERRNWIPGVWDLAQGEPTWPVSYSYWAHWQQVVLSALSHHRNFKTALACWSCNHPGATLDAGCCLYMCIWLFSSLCCSTCFSLDVNCQEKQGLGFVSHEYWVTLNGLFGQMFRFLCHCSSVAHANWTHCYVGWGM